MNKSKKKKKTKSELRDRESDTNCTHYLFIYYIVICMNCDVCRCVHVLYKYNITLYNLIVMK